MALRLNGQTSGYVELDVPAAAGSHTLTLPDSGGSSGQYLQTNGSGTLSWQTVADTNTQGYTWLSDTTMSGAGTIAITGIDSNATDIIMVFAHVGMASTGWMQFRVGNGSEDTNNVYEWSVSAQSTGSEFAAANSIFRIVQSGYGSSSHRHNGHIRLIRNDDDHFIMSGCLGSTVSGTNTVGGRYYGTNGIDRVSISTGTGNFTAGRVKVGYIV